MLTVYTTQTCSQCALVKRYLMAKNIPFETVDVTNDEKMRDMLFSLTGYRVVSITTNDAGDKYVVGFKPEELKNL